MKLFESVPNFSEGRNLETIEAIAGAARQVPGVTVLDVEHNADHNRSVISLVGEGSPLLDALLRMAREAVERIDLNHHRGEHPRMGAIDVVPFVPLGEATAEDARALATDFGRRIWSQLRIPVYYYGQAARVPERADLAAVRKGGFEGLRDSVVTDASRRPDEGDPALHPTAGAVAVGVRPILIAYNVNLNTPDVAVAKHIAHVVRGRDGGLPEVKALGFLIAERNQAQVSMNLTDFHRTPIQGAFEAVRVEAAKAGVEVDDSEIVGLVPEDALFDAAEFYLRLKHFDRETILERKVRSALSSSSNRPSAELASLPISEYAQRLAARTPTPGGGSAAAVVGALGSALGEMVIAYSQPKVGEVVELTETAERLARGRQAFLDDIDRDARAFDQVRSSRSALRASPGELDARTKWREAIELATEIPLGVAERATQLRAALDRVAPQTKALLHSDLLSALALFDAARAGGLANAEVNLTDLESAGGDVGTVRSRIARVRSSERA